jgi:hypothetical protein
VPTCDGPAHRKLYSVTVQKIESGLDGELSCIRVVEDPDTLMVLSLNKINCAACDRRGRKPVMAGAQSPKKHPHIVPLAADWLPVRWPLQAPLPPRLAVMGWGICRG